MAIVKAIKADSIKKIGRITALFFFPLFGSAILALPAYLLQADNQISSLLIYGGQLLVSLYLIYRWYSFKDCGLGGIPQLSSFLWAFSFLALRSLTWVIFLPYRVSLPKWEILIPDLLFFLFVNGATEEIHFRGLLYSGTLKEISRPVVAAAISSFLFGLLHLSLGQPSWIPLFIADGLAWCAIRMRTNSVYPAILSHGLQNLLFTDILLVPQDLSPSTEIIYTVTAIAVDLVFFQLVGCKNLKQYEQITRHPGNSRTTDS
ncbi:CPBP family intramembrane glutamic endopeptidase [Microcystis aeruginosa]|uniref:CPBP family intramembrane glutamic endopeptidase n=1 Tax=Microcystis aeruginosa TaxID=1126 RepID=UPI000933BD73|nr:type II CAAX endopeptidase family protein [Microcystis aeruginosa]